MKPPLTPIAKKPFARLDTKEEQIVILTANVVVGIDHEKRQIYIPRSQIVTFAYDDDATVILVPHLNVNCVVEIPLNDLHEQFSSGVNPLDLSNHILDDGTPPRIEKGRIYIKRRSQSAASYTWRD